MAVLIIQSGKHQGRKLTIPAEEVVIGRDEGCFIRLASTDVSRKHCRLKATPHGIAVSDLGSSNGTYVNDELISKETYLGPGDLLRVGPIEFSVPGVRPKAAAPRVDDDEIADWLTEGEESSGEKGVEMDTTILKTTTDMQPMLATRTKYPPPAKKQFKSVAEEAQDIIRRHKEWLAAQGEE